MKAIVNEEVHAKHHCIGNVKNITDALYVLNGKWKLALIFTLREGPQRFNRILGLIEGITPKVLAKELKELELNGFITRTEMAGSPPVILYETTAYSHTLKNVLFELSSWGEQHRGKIKEEMRGKTVSR
jgi:DNA-binding HxlR family transcriptional regulator